MLRLFNSAQFQTTKRETTVWRKLRQARPRESYDTTTGATLLTVSVESECALLTSFSV